MPETHHTDPVPTGPAPHSDDALLAMPPFAIGSAQWPGLAKLAEECGEVLQLVGKIMAYPVGEHPDGEGDLAERLTSELGDLKAAIDYVGAHNADVARRAIDERRDMKFTRFQRWDGEERRRCAWMASQHLKAVEQR